jgi:hypothetical protein
MSKSEGRLSIFPIECAFDRDFVRPMFSHEGCYPGVDREKALRDRDSGAVRNGPALEHPQPAVAAGNDPEPSCQSAGIDPENDPGSFRR